MTVNEARALLGRLTIGSGVDPAKLEEAIRAIVGDEVLARFEDARAIPYPGLAFGPKKATW